MNVDGLRAEPVAGRAQFNPFPQFAGQRWAVVAASCAVTLLYLVRMLPRLPGQALTTGDSNAYLQLESFRPPLYGWFLNAWQWLHGSLDGLPSLQLVMLVGVLVFAIEFGLMARNALLAAVTVPVIMAHPAIWEASRWMMTESLYLLLVLLGMASQFRYVRRGDLGSLVGAAVMFALATITRNTGLIFLLLPLGAALFDRRHGFLAGTRQALLAAAAALVVLLGAMSWNASRHGSFEIGTWNGISLLTKSLPLLEPEDVAGMPPPVAAVLPYVEKSRALIAAQPDIASRLRAHVQVTSSDLRWGVFIPEAASSWPAWRDADWNTRGKLAGDLSRVLIHRHPFGALSLWAQDWLVLVLQPAYWPSSLTSTTSDASDFVACGRDNSCWALDRYDIPAHNRVVLLTASIVGPLVALLLIVLDAGKVLRRRADSAVVLTFMVALVIHATLLGMSAFEAGGARFTVAVHVLELPLLIWAAARFGRWVQARWFGRPADGDRPGLYRGSAA